MFKRKILIASLLSFSIFSVSGVLAQTPSPEGTVAGQTQQEKIEDLKERVATKVAQMKTVVASKALVGEISSVDKESLSLKTAQGEKKILITEDSGIFRITRGRKTSIATTNLKAGERVAVIGATDSQGDFVARIILAKILPQNINGVIENIDSKNFTISVKNNKTSVTYLIDIESTTKIQSWDQGEGLQKTGFSKLKVGDRVHINGSPVQDEQNQISASRILSLPGLATGITGVNPTVSPSPTATPSVKKPTATPSATQ